MEEEKKPQKTPQAKFPSTQEETFDQLYHSLTHGMSLPDGRPSLPILKNGELIPPPEPSEIMVEKLPLPQADKKSHRGRKKKKKESCRCEVYKVENDELRKQINDLKVTLKINKDCMKIMLEPANQFKSINIVNSFVKENIKLQNEVFRVQKKLITLLHNQTQSRLNKASKKKKSSKAVNAKKEESKKPEENSQTPPATNTQTTSTPSKPPPEPSDATQTTPKCPENPETSATNPPPSSTNLDTSNAETDRLNLQTEYISQLKENNKVLKDLIRNKNKEVISLELTVKKIKLDHRKEISTLKKQVAEEKANGQKYKNFIGDLLRAYMEQAFPVILEDPAICQDCPWLLFLHEKFSSATGNEWKEDGIVPEEFEEKIAEVSEKLKEMQEDQGDCEGEDLEMEEQDEPNDIGQEIVHLTEPQMRQKLIRGNSATVIMMGQKEAEQFLSSRLSNAKVFEKDRNSVRYLSNVPESLKELKSLNTFKQKGRWELMPKDNQTKSFAFQGPEQEGEEEDYYEYDDYEQQIQDDQEIEGEYDEYDLDYQESPRNNPLSANKRKERSSSPSSQNYQGGISLSNLNKYYKK